MLYVTVAVPDVSGALNPQPVFLHPVFWTPFNFHGEPLADVVQSPLAVTENTSPFLIQEGPESVIHEGSFASILVTRFTLLLGLPAAG